MNEVLLDQIPVLVDLHRFIEEMRLMQDLPNSNVDALLVQQVMSPLVLSMVHCVPEACLSSFRCAQEPEVQQQLLRSDFQQLAADFLQMVRDMSEEDRRKQLQRFRHPASIHSAPPCFPVLLMKVLFLLSGMGGWMTAVSAYQRPLAALMRPRMGRTKGHHQQVLSNLSRKLKNCSCSMG